MKLEGEKRYALFLACKDSDYVKKMYGGYYNVFVDAFAEEGQIWDSYSVVEGDFPSMDDLCKYDGAVISGSPNDAHGEDPWILKLCSIIRTLVSMKKKVLGICFGHQVLCRALGGKIGRNQKGWDIGVRTVTINTDLPTCNYLKALENIPPCLSIIECHQDEVWEIPCGAKVIACSEKTCVEVFCMGENVLGIQGHPEYTKDILHSLIDRLSNNETIEMTFADDVRVKLQTTAPNRDCWEKICKRFLTGKITSDI